MGNGTKQQEKGTNTNKCTCHFIKEKEQTFFLFTHTVSALYCLLELLLLLIIIICKNVCKKKRAKTKNGLELDSKSANNFGVLDRGRTEK